LAEARKILSITEEVPQTVATGRLVNWGDFVNETASDPYDWLIDGLIERQERVVIVAAEGVGKTTLARQVAICAGAGVHPFTYMEIPPVRTLFVDLENPERIIRRQARKLVESIKINYGKRPGEADLYMKPDGINILNPKDRELLERQIVKTDAQLLVLGPIYKSYVDPGNRSSTALITEVCTYFDYLRANYGVTLWLEHHAPLGNALTGRDMRPADSAVWMRWPEFGFGITRDPTTMEKEYEWKGFREPRDERNFPLRMKRGTILPFEVISFRSSMT
jgi:replicative DNA helicase